MRLDSRLRACVRACGRHAPVRRALCETLLHSIDLVVCEGLGVGGRGERPAEEEEEERESGEAGCSAPHAEDVQHAILRGAPVCTRSVNQLPTRTGVFIGGRANGGGIAIGGCILI